MDKKRLEELYNRAVDGCLSPDDERELARYLEDHPQLMAEIEAFDGIRRIIRAHVPAQVEPPYPDFFNAHLERLIREDEADGSPVAGRKSRLSRWTGWLVPAGAAAVLAFFAGMQLAGPAKPAGPAMGALVPVVYSPLTSVRPEAMVDRGTGGTVIVLEGLEAIPDTVDLAQASWDREDGLRLASARETY